MWEIFRKKRMRLYLVELQVVIVRYNQKQFPLNMFWKFCEVSGAGNTDWLIYQK